MGVQGILQLIFARHKAKRAKMRKRMRAYFKSLMREKMERVMTGWGYKPKLNPAARKPHCPKAYWHRVRSFCVRKGYH